MLELVQKIKRLFLKEKPFEIVICNDKIQIHINSNVELILKDDLDITIDGDINIYYNNVNIDTKQKLFLNSKTSKQIKDLPESIEFWEKLLKFRPEMKEISDQLTKDSVPMNITDEEKIKKLSKLVPLDVTDAGRL